MVSIAFPFGVPTAMRFDPETLTHLACAAWYPIRFQDLTQLRKTLDTFQLRRADHPQAILQIAAGLSWRSHLDENEIRSLAARMERSDYQSGNIVSPCNASRTLTERARAKEIQMANDLHWENEGWPVTDRRWRLFSPSEHFSTGLINEEVIEGLRKEKTLLSVGAGPGYLEQFLVREFGIDASRISLADINVHAETDPFEKWTFDMTEDWPAFHKKFDYILFPSSFTCIAQRYPETWSGGDDSKRAEGCRSVIRKALTRIAKGGEIRIDWHYLAPAQFFWVGALILEQEPAVQMQYDRHFLRLAIP